jgi:hypothetical protein
MSNWAKYLLTGVACLCGELVIVCYLYNRVRSYYVNKGASDGVFQ